MMDKIQGDKFRQFVEDNRKNVCRRIMLGFKLSEDDAKDIFQDSTIALYNHIEDGKDVSLEKFFAGICYRQTLKFLRKHKRTVNYDMSNPLSEVNKGTGISFNKLNEIVNTIPTNGIYPQTSTPPDEAFDLKRMKERVSKALDDMAQRCRQLLTKYYLEGYSWTELALLLELKNADTAKAAANRCRRRFEEKYKDLEVYLKG